MAIVGSKSPVLAAVLSGVLPGLGQFYTRQWRKGAAFLVGFLVLAGIFFSVVDPEALQRAAASGATPDNLGQIFLLAVLILALALWSIVDAVRSARGRQ